MFHDGTKAQEKNTGKEQCPGADGLRDTAGRGADLERGIGKHKLGLWQRGPGFSATPYRLGLVEVLAQGTADCQGVIFEELSGAGDSSL